MNYQIFDKYVGLKEFPQSPAPLDFVNTVSNVSQDLINLLILDSSVEEVWKDVRITALQCLELSLKGKICKLADFNSTIDETETADIQEDNPIFQHGSGLHYDGLVFQTNSIKNAEISFNRLFFFVTSDNIDQTVFKIFNLRSGEEVYSLDITPEFALNSIPLDFKEELNFGSGKYFACIVVPSGAELHELCTPESENGNINITSGTISIDQTVTANNISDYNCFIHVDMKIEYNFMKLIEQNVEKLALIFKLLCAADLLERCLKSKKAHQQTLINRDEQRVLIEDLKKEADRGIVEIAKVMYHSLRKVPNVVEPTPDTKAGNYLDSFV